MKKVFIFFCFLSLTQLVHGQDGTLDLTFGINGRVKSDVSLGSILEIPQAIVIQNDGKIIVAGVSISPDPDFVNSAKITLIRYNTDGRIDSSYGSNGRVLTSFGTNFYSVPSSMALQTDGKLVVAGTTQGISELSFLVLRYTTNGLLDTTFNKNGGVITRFGAGGTDQSASLTIQPDGKILVAGSSNSQASVFEQGFNRIALVRFTTSGALDTTFNGTGKVITQLNTTKDALATSITLQNDNKIVICGIEYINALTPDYQADRFLIRYNNNGIIDTSFGVNGIVKERDGSARRVKILDSGKILVGGSEGLNSFALFRYNTNGAVDATFGTNGKITTTFGNQTNSLTDMLVQKDGKVILVGLTSDISSSVLDFAMVRFLENGVLDNFFGTNGKVRVSTFTNQQQSAKIAIQNDNKLVVLGATTNIPSISFTVLRFNNRLGTNVATVSKPSNFMLYPNPTKNDLNIDLKDAIHSDFSIKISDLTGRIVYQNKYDKTLINNTLKINISDLITGLYVVTIQSEKEIMSQLISKN